MEHDMLPAVPRFNSWWEWKPIIATCPHEEYFQVRDAADRLPSPQAKAIYLYGEFTGCTGIEFVLVSNTSDETFFRRLPNGIVVVPCPQPRFSGPPDVSLYDGWMPLPENSGAAITKGISDLDEVMSFWSHVLESSTRLIIKYAECVGGRHPMWHIENDDYDSVARALTRLRALPTALQTATIRSLHWRQHAQVQIRPTDRLLALWQAFESLLAAAYDHAADIDLPLDDPTRTLSKRQRNQAKGKLARQILDSELASNPLEAVKHAYFDAVVGIRRRCESALRAMLGPEDPRIVETFDTAPSAWSPNRIRNLLMHEGCSATEVELACDIHSRVENLDKLVKEVIARVLGKYWLGQPLGTRQRNCSVTQSPVNSIICSPGGGATARGDFTITFGLLASMGFY